MSFRFYVGVNLPNNSAGIDHEGRAIPVHRALVFALLTPRLSVTRLWYRPADRC
jgi:hypothetical protein